MRVLIPALTLLAAAEGAAAHALDAGHTVTEQLAHQFASPHHAFLLLALSVALVSAHRWFRLRRHDKD